MNMRAKIVLVSTVLLALLVSSPAVAVDVCGQPFVFISGEPDPVDIDCATGYVIADNSTVNLLSGAHLSDTVGGGVGTGNLVSGGYNTINIYGGQIDGMLNFVSTDVVTVYVSSVDPIPGILDVGQDQIVNSGASTLIFDLVGTYEDDTAFSLPCYLESDAILNLNLPQTAPEIEVYPALLEHDFGDVEIGSPQTYVVQILNVGTADLEVSSLTLTGNSDFAVSNAPAVPFTVAPSESIAVDVEITYTPVQEGYVTATLGIVSNDEDESLVEVVFGGVGIIVELPPQQQIQNILDFIDISVAEGTMLAYGPGNLPQLRLRALQHMVRSAGRLIDAGYPNWAICVLSAVDRKTDGEKRPPDFVVGEAVPQLNAMVQALISDLTS